ncbi:unnamed protein product [marine sediment metagenome]|uniref:Uncharacterized protein n=1 Tax=marine sediment metagenome TaxID=412755 RepID=X1AL97_9ZZZZ
MDLDSKSDLRKRLEGMDLPNQLREIIFVLEDNNKRLDRIDQKLKEILDAR